MPDVKALQALEHMQAVQSKRVKCAPLFRLYSKVSMMGSLALGIVLHKLAPSKYRMPVYVFQALNDASTPFSRIKLNIQLSAAVLTAASGGLSAMIAWAVWRAARGLVSGNLA